MARSDKYTKEKHEVKYIEVAGPVHFFDGAILFTRPWMLIQRDLVVHNLWRPREHLTCNCRHSFAY